MRKQKRSVDAFWFGIGLALGIFLTQRRVNRPGRIAQLAAWERALAARFGVQKAALLAAKVQARNEKLFDGRPLFRNRVLRNHLESHILPGIALYQVLQEETVDSAEALAILDSCFLAHLQGSRMALQAKLLDLLPGGFAFLRIANRALLRMGYPEQGWQIDWVEDSPSCIVYNITGCFYLNVLGSYKVPELTSHFCAGDDHLYGNLKTITWGRTETLGRGDARCNFVFRPRVPLDPCSGRCESTTSA